MGKIIFHFSPEILRQKAFNRHVRLRVFQNFFAQLLIEDIPALKELGVGPPLRRANKNFRELMPVRARLPGDGDEREHPGF